jgi:hypothetical protein
MSLERTRKPRGAATDPGSGMLEALQSVLAASTQEDGLDFRQANRVLQFLIDGIERGDPAALGLIGAPQRGDLTYPRTVRTTLVAVAIGRRLGLDRAALSDLAIAALFHGVGRDPKVKPEYWGFAGALRIAGSATLSRTTLRAIEVALETHEDVAAPRSVLSQVVAIAGTYARLVGARDHAGKPLTPAQALGAVLGPLATRFDPALRAALVEALGIHPPGQFVGLDNGEIALVIAPRGDDPARPIVQVVTTPGGRPLHEAERRAGGPLPEERSIVRDLAASEVPGLEAA